MTNTNRGGSRPNAGRKKVADKKVSVFAYVPESQVEALGGKEAAKEIAEAAISRAAKRKIKTS